HMRLIMETLGIPLSNFSRTKRMVEALCDAIKGHQQTYSTGVLHRDVSEGNVYMIEDKPYKGFIGDFDYSSFMPGVHGGHDDPTRPDANQNDFLKERTGTYAFMSIELLEEKSVIRGAHHDLESFYWLLIKLVLRHTVHGDPEGTQQCSMIKTQYVPPRSEHPHCSGNSPLTWLLRELTMLCYRGQSTLEGPGMLLTYEAMLEKFETALKMDSWPDTD
ncbi:hypothetical protein BKA93DRAFT_700621, partial [Sparassis latifolia]